MPAFMKITTSWFTCVYLCDNVEVIFSSRQKKDD